VTPGPRFDAEQFFAQASAAGFRVLDASLFTQRLSGMLSATFLRMLLICAAGVVCLLLLLFLDPVLPLLSLLPVGFALLSTLGTLKLCGRPVDIPGLLLAVIVMGMGIDYALFFVRSHQRYGDDNHESNGPVRTAVFLASMSTLVGFGALALSDHALLRSAGFTGFFAILYSVVGAFTILPPLLRFYFAARPQPRGTCQPGSPRHRSRTVRLFARLEPYPRQFARFKLLCDPMFPTLKDLVPHRGVLLDVGCGYGVPGAWLTTAYPELTVHGIEPDPERVRVARRVLAGRGTVTHGAAPHLPAHPQQVDGALMLDMAHYLSDHDLAATLDDLRRRLRPPGRLIMRVTVPATGKRVPWERLVERLRGRWLAIPLFFRSPAQLTTIFRQAGFRLERVEPSAATREETWFVASAEGEAEGDRQGDPHA